MSARETEVAVEATSEAAVPAPAGGALVPFPSLSTPGLLALQRSIGNAAVGRLLQRRVTMTTEGEVSAPAVTGSAAWTEAEVRTIQRELTRLRLYNLTRRRRPRPAHRGEPERGIRRRVMALQDRHRGHRVAARAAESRVAGRSLALHCAELFRDGVLDVTFGMGFLEGDPPPEEAVAAPQSAGAEPLRAAPEALTPRSVLLLQRAIGNAAVARVVAGQAAVARRIHGEDVVPDAIGADAWSDSEVRAIQSELKRIGLYDARIDGSRGPKHERGPQRGVRLRGVAPRCRPPRSTRS